MAEGGVGGGRRDRGGVVIAAARVGELDAADRWLSRIKGAGIDAFDAAKCETAVAAKRAEMASPPDRRWW